ncbi:MAG: hypothetical protein AAGC55_26375, partial [Myxococcota bacterium]
MSAVLVVGAGGSMTACGDVASSDGPSDATDAGPVINDDDENVARSYPGPCLIETDVGLDETIDARDMRTSEDDLLATLERDNDADGVIDYRQLRSFD